MSGYCFPYCTKQMKNEIKLLIADDETNIRLGLQTGIDWQELGIDRVFAARDGQEAYRLCMEYKIELVLTDIRMPGLDGLELGRRLNYEPLRIVIMSGFADFDYAHDAIKLGAVDYLLKPVNIQALKELIQKLVAQIISVKNAAMALGEEGSFGLKMHQVIFGRDPTLNLSENSFSPLLVRAFAYINERYADRITVEDVARHLGKSNNYFSSCFKRSTGTSFVDYLARVRIEHARRMLRTTSMMTYEIADKVGFYDYKYFSTVFKRIVGCSPSAYRKKMEQ